jgi:hypothetical protein
MGTKRRHITALPVRFWTLRYRSFADKYWASGLPCSIYLAAITRYSAREQALYKIRRTSGS